MKFAYDFNIKILLEKFIFL